MIINILPAKNKELFLLGILVTMVALIEGQAFLFKPKIAIDRQGLFEPFSRDVPRADSYSPQVSAATLEKKENPPAARGPELELLGTAVGNTKDPIAFIKDLTTGKQGIRRIGSVIGDARIIEITFGEVILDVKGKRESLRLSKRALSWAKAEEETGAIISMSAGEVIVSRKGIRDEMDTIMNTLPQLRVKPYYEAGGVSGLMIEGVARDSIIAAAGIKNKDVVRAVNNQKIDSYQKALQVLYKAKGQSEINIDLLRDGQAANLCYRITN
jgi:type II secretory pathway component PulC